MLTLQAVGDGVTIPAIHGGLQSIVDAAGHRRELAQLWIEGAGHCTFSPAEMFAALKTLEQRIDSGRWSVAPKDVARAAKRGDRRRRHALHALHTAGAAARLWRARGQLPRRAGAGGCAR